MRPIQRGKRRGRLQQLDAGCDSCSQIKRGDIDRTAPSDCIQQRAQDFCNTNTADMVIILWLVGVPHPAAQDEWPGVHRSEVLSLDPTGMIWRDARDTLYLTVFRCDCALIGCGLTIIFALKRRRAAWALILVISNGIGNSISPPMVPLPRKHRLLSGLTRPGSQGKLSAYPD